MNDRSERKDRDKVHYWSLSRVQESARESVTVARQERGTGSMIRLRLARQRVPELVGGYETRYLQAAARLRTQALLQGVKQLVSM